MGKLFKMNTSLIGVALISVFAFLGFGAIFQKYEISIATQALTAAFGALFVLLSTKFLMEQEGENRVIGEKRSVVFKENVSDYKRAVQVLLKVMDKKSITTNDIQIMLKSHALLILLADADAIEGYSRFIEKCQSILEHSDLSADLDTDNSIENAHAEILAENEAELWSLMIDFLAAARGGLALMNDTLTVEKEKSIFRNISIKQADIEANIQARRPLGGVEEWLEKKNIASTHLGSVKKIIEIMNDAGLMYKVTATQISFFDPTHLKNRRVVYLERYNKQQDCFVMTFNSTKDEAFTNNLCDRLSNRNAKPRNPRDGQYDVLFSINTASVQNDHIEDLKSAIKFYMNSNHQG